MRCSRLQEPALASSSQVAASGDRWMLMAVGGISGARARSA
jgi:hypothetical protein